MIQIRLTEKEADVLLHRAYQPDCIAEVFSDTLEGWTTERVEALLAETINHTPGKGLVVTFDPDNTDHVAVLTELLEGNTTGDAADDYAAYDSDEPEYRIGVALRRACKAVERKFHAAGISATIP